STRCVIEEPSGNPIGLFEPTLPEARFLPTPQALYPLPAKDGLAAPRSGRLSYGTSDMVGEEVF
ncbi:MAG TPA: hypothetical protein VNL71_19110, partial [Chloroflexota bacterium]|nr:hypothetical protein [Chloroflexota bacterium]